jgi:hypothetical protein
VLWLSYWEKKLVIHHEYKKLKACGKLSLWEVQNHFLVFIFHFNMWTSIVVDTADPEWKENQVINNSYIIK